MTDEHATKEQMIILNEHIVKLQDKVEQQAKNIDALSSFVNTISDLALQNNKYISKTLKLYACN